MTRAIRAAHTPRLSVAEMSGFVAELSEMTLVPRILSREVRELMRPELPNGARRPLARVARYLEVLDA